MQAAWVKAQLSHSIAVRLYWCTLIWQVPWSLHPAGKICCLEDMNIFKIHLVTTLTLGKERSTILPKTGVLSKL